MAAPAAPMGLIPAAGAGLRMRPYRAPKELLPLLLRHPAYPQAAQPTPVCMFSLRAVRAAGAAGCVVAISDGKQEVMRSLAGGQELSLPLAYVHQDEPRGLPDVVRSCEMWLGGRDVVFAMPDTVFLPEDALATLHRARVETGVDVMMGLFRAGEPERLGAVELDAHGAVVHIHDKPGHRQWPWCWGVLAWSDAFTRYCCGWEESRRKTRPTVEGVLGHVMEAARQDGMRVGAHCFQDGVFLDVGTPQGLAQAIEALGARGLLYGVHP